MGWEAGSDGLHQVVRYLCGGQHPHDADHVAVVRGFPCTEQTRAFMHRNAAWSSTRTLKVNITKNIHH